MCLRLILATILLVAAGCASGGGGVGAGLPTPPSGGGSSAGSQPPSMPGSPGTGADAGGEDGGTTGGELPGEGQAGGPTGGAEDSEGAGDLPGTSSQSTGRQAELEEELADSLEEFDGMLLGERERLAERRSAGADRGPGSPASSGSSGSSPGDVGGAADTSGGGNGATSPTEDGASGTSDQPADRGEEDDRGESRVPDDIPDASDDDIVARQLREAAMNEADPQLREKLWDEYRRYKRGGRLPKERSNG